MISIVMTYYQRQEQLSKTLDSFRKYDPKDFNVIIVDDGSPTDIKIAGFLYDIVILKIRNKTWLMGDPAWNIGLNRALSSDIIILQNAECYHYGNILDYAKNITDEKYISFGCYSQAQGEEIGTVFNNIGASRDFESAWYNHPAYRPVGYHFCAAITSNNMRKLNGFDERFMDGVGYDDDYFLHQVRCLGLNVEITAEPFVIHQWHEKIIVNDNLCEKNKALFEELSKGNNYRAEHLITPDL